MKTTLEYKLPRSFCCLPAAGGLLLALALLLNTSASAQELLQNPGFELPFPGTDATTNWTLVYVDGGPGDFAIAGQSTEASRTGGGRGAHLRADNFTYAHAYFKQVVRTGITNGGHYLLTIQKMKAGFQNYVDSGKLQVYMAAISGTSSNVVFGDGTILGPYSLVVTGSPSRSIEVQLHMAKGQLAADGSADFKSAKCTGWFDDISLTWTP